MIGSNDQNSCSSPEEGSGPWCRRSRSVPISISPSCRPCCTGSVLARGIEDLFEKWTKDGTFTGWWHPGRGQEGAAVGAMAALGHNDQIMWYHRGADWPVARGMNVELVIADLLGRVNGARAARAAGHRTSLTWTWAWWVPAARSARPMYSAAGSPSPSRCSASRGSSWPASATAPQPAAHFTKRLCKRFRGSCRCSTFARTTAGRYRRPSACPLPQPPSPSARRPTESLACVWTARMPSWCTRR